MPTSDEKHDHANSLAARESDSSSNRAGFSALLDAILATPATKPVQKKTKKIEMNKENKIKKSKTLPKSLAELIGLTMEKLKKEKERTSSRNFHGRRNNNNKNRNRKSMQATQRRFDEAGFGDNRRSDFFTVEDARKPVKKDPVLLVHPKSVDVIVSPILGGNDMEKRKQLLRLLNKHFGSESAYKEGKLQYGDDDSAFLKLMAKRVATTTSTSSNTSPTRGKSRPKFSKSYSSYSQGSTAQSKTAVDKTGPKQSEASTLKGPGDVAIKKKESSFSLLNPDFTAILEQAAKNFQKNSKLERQKTGSLPLLPHGNNFANILLGRNDNNLADSVARKEFVPSPNLPQSANSAPMAVLSSTSNKILRLSSQNS